MKNFVFTTDTSNPSSFEIKCRPMNQACTYCGDAIPNGSVFCPGCGANVGRVDKPAGMGPLPSVDSNIPGESSSNTFWTLGLTLTAILIGVPIIAMLVNKGSVSQPIPTVVSGANAPAPGTPKPIPAFDRLRFAAFAVTTGYSDSRLADAKTDNYDSLIDSFNQIPPSSSDYKEAQEIIRDLEKKRSRIIHFHDVMGQKPEALTDGKIQAVDEYL